MAIKRKSYNRAERDNRDRDNTSARKRARALDPSDIVDLNNVDVLRRFVTEHGKILPPRLTGVTAAQQRQIKKGVRRARNMGLMA
jgi:small subunit ribosomal protein S18